MDARAAFPVRAVRAGDRVAAVNVGTFVRLTVWTALPAALAALPTSISWAGREGPSDEAATPSTAAEAAVNSALFTRVAHEARTPLDAVIGTAERLLDSELTAEQHEQMIAIQSAGSALREILNDVLGSSDAGSVDVEQEHSPVPLRALVRAERGDAVRPRRVLVVAHAATNQLVAQRMLEREGYAVQIASNGADALMALERGREASLAAGMDDTLQRPLTRDPLSEMLRRWLDTEPEQRVA